MDNQPETLDSPNEEPTAEAEPTQDVAALEARLRDTEAKNRQLFERAKKAEGFDLKDGHWVKRSQPAPETRPTTSSAEPQVSIKDMLALTEAKVSSRHYDEVVNYAQFKGITVADALQDKTLKAILTTRNEEDVTAAATQIKSSRGAMAPSGDSLLLDAERGNLPDEADIDKLVDARMDAKQRK